MEYRDKFSDLEWRAVLGGVFMTGFAVTAAQPSGFLGMIKEGIASRRALREASKSGSTNALVKSVATALRSPRGRKITNEFAGAALQGAASEDLKLHAIAAVREALAPPGGPYLDAQGAGAVVAIRPGRGGEDFA
jgi:hypothetical protein